MRTDKTFGAAGITNYNMAQILRNLIFKRSMASAEEQPFPISKQAFSGLRFHVLVRLTHKIRKVSISLRL